ncbi:NAD(P)H-dependent oxidoreductase [Cohnella endophytica]|uniref:NAD(P)H-dependent oxidoreductase n=1 Tax=Cohnella endophytica TaxID=2419778 RepID=A0A494Y3T5_9BACL|nr:NADPH-dependent FMN reductase [Cohnella endophytica]RKP57364.1 NAD(P)H-dependent oxidoreductase [Cohnella endophytica]
MKIVLIAGSNRRNATSTQLLKYMADTLGSQGADTALINLYDHPLPLYAPDDETLDENAAFLIRSVDEADAIVLGTPEYHGSISGALKNALDYLGSNEFLGKPVLSVSSSGGAVGVSSLTHLQAIVRNLHGLNSPEWLSLGGNARQFAADGSPADSGVKQRVARALDTLVSLTRVLRPTSNVKSSEVRV